MPHIKTKPGAGYLGLEKAEPIWELKRWGQREVWKVVTHGVDERTTDTMDPRMLRGLATQALMFKKRDWSRDAIFFSTVPSNGPLNEGGTQAVLALAKEMKVKVPAGFQCHGDVYEVRDEDWWWTVALPADAVTFILRDAYWFGVLGDDLLTYRDNGSGKADISFKSESERKAFKVAYSKWAGIPAKRRAA